ncbi:caspase family protein [Ensifer canadensis]
MRWRATLRFMLLPVLVVMLAATPALAQEGGKRLALIVGISDYTVVGALPNAARDAEAFDGFLTQQDFETDLVLNADRRGLAEALARFSRKVGADDVALFYYAGHGMQLHGENYLVSTDARLESEFDIPAETVPLSEIINALEKRARISLIFLDACRDNPLANRLNVEIEGASRGGATRGLAPIETHGAGTMVAFAAAPGQVAADGTDGHSPFTRALIANLSGAGLEVGTAFKRVVRDVRRETSGKQSPQLLSSLALEFYFGDVAGRPVEEKPAISTDRPTADLVALDFGKAMRVDTPRAWRWFLGKHGDSAYAEAARQSVTRLATREELRSPLAAMAQEQRDFADRQSRATVQTSLIEAGFDTGTVDGNFGSQTRLAITSFQRARGLLQTGFVNQETAAALGLATIAPKQEVLSLATARRYDADDLDGLEDARVVDMVRCLSPLALTYGRFDGHLYAAAYGAEHVGWEDAHNAAARCGGYLATINSAEENAFIASLVNGDGHFFDSAFEGGEHRRVGPWLGLVKDDASGPWRWASGAPLDYTRWFRQVPKAAGAGILYVAYRANQLPLAATIETWGARDRVMLAPGFIVEFD